MSEKFRQYITQAHQAMAAEAATAIAGEPVVARSPEGAVAVKVGGDGRLLAIGFDSTRTRALDDNALSEAIVRAYTAAARESLQRRVSANAKAFTAFTARMSQTSSPKETTDDHTGR